MLCEGHAPVHVGHIEYKYKDSREAEKVEYNIKALEVETCMQLERLLKARKLTREIFWMFRLLPGATMVMRCFRWAQPYTSKQEPIKFSVKYLSPRSYAEPTPPSF